jgi:hypothetical protein
MPGWSLPREDTTMIAVHFDKAYAEMVLDALKTGKPIPPLDPAGWTGNNQLMLAGILYAGVFSQGPHTHEIQRINAKAAKAMDAEKREATDETLNRDIHIGIQYLSGLTSAVLNQEYDALFDPTMAAVLQETEDGQKKLYAGHGFKKV